MRILHTNGRGNAVHQQFGFQFEHEYGRANAMPLPGTEEVKHISSSYVEYRRQGLGSTFHKERLRHFAEDESTTALTCIVNGNNVAEIKILEANGWERLKTFKGCVGQDLLLYFKEL